VETTNVLKISFRVPIVQLFQFGELLVTNAVVMQQLPEGVIFCSGGLSRSNKPEGKTVEDIEHDTSLYRAGIHHRCRLFVPGNAKD
jgi:hypothetical protein